MYMFYQHRIDRLKFNKKTISIFIFFIIIFAAIFVNYRDAFMAKFNEIKGLEDMYEVVNSRRGGSAYLMGLEINSWWKIILFSPVCMFYFLISPLPMYWRGIEDIIAFLMDGIIYFYLVTYSILNLRKSKINKRLLIDILIMVLSFIFVFGIGVKNAGTAMRHRHKILPIIIVLYTITKDSKKKNKQDIDKY